MRAASRTCDAKPGRNFGLRVFGRDLRGFAVKPRSGQKYGDDDGANEDREIAAARICEHRHSAITRARRRRRNAARPIAKIETSNGTSAMLMNARRPPSASISLRRLCCTSRSCVRVSTSWWRNCSISVCCAAVRPVCPAFALHPVQAHAGAAAYPSGAVAAPVLPAGTGPAPWPECRARL